jgi:ribosomal protein S27AE
MTLDEILHEFQSCSSRDVPPKLFLAIQDAIPAVREVKESRVWNAKPRCPRCGSKLIPDFLYRTWTCENRRCPGVYSSGTRKLYRIEERT